MNATISLKIYIEPLDQGIMNNITLQDILFDPMKSMSHIETNMNVEYFDGQLISHEEKYIGYIGSNICI